jgi:tetratricopeptide (TPR) repeat protein
MVMGSLFFRRWVKWAFLIALAFALSALRLVADDQIIKNDGNVVNGQIVGVSDGQVTIESHSSNGGIAKFPITISDIKSIIMAVPADVTKAEVHGVAPAEVIAALEPQVKQFAGLPADWVVEAMAALGDAYAAGGQSDRALAIYNQISQLYPGSAYENVAAAGKAKLNLKAGKIDEALAAVQPIVDQANKDIAPSPSVGALYANAFLVYGQVLEAQKKPQQALEAYLTVKTMFYQNPNLVDQADQLARNLRDQNPGLGIE